jgi:hypothetical protein
LISDDIVVAILSAVKAKNTFGDFDIATGLAAAFTGLLAELAIDTLRFVFADSPYRKSAYDA